MANSYTRFSTSIPLTTDDELAWAREVVAFLDEKAGENITDIAASLAPGAGGSLHPMLALLPDAAEYADECISYTVELSEGSLDIYTDESGEPQHVVPLVQEYLRRFDPDGSFGFAWADTCSAMRPDEFGGGALFVTASSARSVDTGVWLWEQDQLHKTDRPVAAS